MSSLVFNCRRYQLSLRFLFSTANETKKHLTVPLQPPPTSPCPSNLHQNHRALSPHPPPPTSPCLSSQPHRATPTSINITVPSPRTRLHQPHRASPVMPPSTSSCPLRHLPPTTHRDSGQHLARRSIPVCT
ncbi:hypothetical protein LSAT2_021202 [Lamellibrachia satsuma]|nr:hypothetical protein LSAT2_021202 [Lamellibrachia satsuma]